MRGHNKLLKDLNQCVDIVKVPVTPQAADMAIKHTMRDLTEEHGPGACIVLVSTDQGYADTVAWCCSKGTAVILVTRLPVKQWLSLSANRAPFWTTTSTATVANVTMMLQPAVLKHKGTSWASGLELPAAQTAAIQPAFGQECYEPRSNSPLQLSGAIAETEGRCPEDSPDCSLLDAQLVSHVCQVWVRHQALWLLWVEHDRAWYGKVYDYALPSNNSVTQLSSLPLPVKKQAR